MTDNFSPPSMNLADLADPIGIVRLILTKFLQGVDDMLPAQVISYNRTTNLAQVQPLIVMVTTDNIQVQRGQIASVPVQIPGGGDFILSFPIKAGDLGWIKANDRDISLFKQFHESSPPNTQRKHSFEDALFIPDNMMQGVTINSEDANNLVIQSLDGTVRVALWSDRVKITAPQIILDSPLTTCTGEFIAGTNPAYTQTATFNGNIITTGDVIADSISLVTHVHGGVQTGSGDTGAPV